jgi:hypothetical protein
MRNNVITQNGPTIFYITKFSNNIEQFYKPGITSVDVGVKKRYDKVKNFTITIIDELILPTRDLATKCEDEFKGMLYKYKYIPLSFSGSGHTECFTPYSMNMNNIKKFFQNIMPTISRDYTWFTHIFKHQLHRSNIMPNPLLDISTVDFSKEGYIINRSINCEVATEIIEKCSHDKKRDIKSGPVKLYKQQMLNGQWKRDANQIKFTRDGTLGDGNHRVYTVAALSDPNIWIEMHIQTGVDPESIKKMDIGRPRTDADQLAFEFGKDIGNGNEEDSGYDTLFAKDARYTFNVVNTPVGKKPINKKLDKSNTDIIEIFDNPMIKYSVDFCREKNVAAVDTSTQIFAAVHCLISNKYEQAVADDFMNAVTNSTGLDIGNPIHTFREKMGYFRALPTKKRPGGALLLMMKLAYLIRTWIAYNDEKQLFELQWNENSFPSV